MKYYQNLGSQIQPVLNGLFYLETPREKKPPLPPKYFTCSETCAGAQPFQEWSVAN